MILFRLEYVFSQCLVIFNILVDKIKCSMPSRNYNNNMSNRNARKEKNNCYLVYVSKANKIEHNTSYEGGKQNIK